MNQQIGILTNICKIGTWAAIATKGNLEAAIVFYRRGKRQFTMLNRNNTERFEVDMFIQTKKSELIDRMCYRVSRLDVLTSPLFSQQFAFEMAPQPGWNK